MPIYVYSRLSLTRDLLSLITTEGPDDGVVLARHTVREALSIVACLGSRLLGLALCVLLFARLAPVVPACGVSDSLDEVAFDGVELAAVLAVRGVRLTRASDGLEVAHLGWLSLLSEEDMVFGS